MSRLSDRIKETIKEVEDFPKAGISFKDITPLLLDPDLFSEIVDALALPYMSQQVDYVAGIESRGFLYGPALASKLGAGFIPMRKEGKLPRPTLKHTYDLEYGSACIEAHREDIKPGSRFLIHDDLLATGGTAEAAARLLESSEAIVAGYSFIVELGFLNGKEILSSNGAPHLHSLLTY